MRLSPLALSLILVACGSGNGGKTTETAPTTSSGTDGGTAGGVPGGTETVLANATLRGTIQDCDGNALEGISIRFCDAGNCRFHDTLADGAYTFGNSVVGWNSFEAIGTGGLATSYVPVQLGDAQDRVMDVRVCPHDPATNLTGSNVEMSLGDGLLVTLSTAAIEPPAFVDPATEASGVLLDSAAWVDVDGISGTVAAQWFVEPFNHTATAATGLPVRFDGALLGLAGTSYHAYVGSYDDFAWLDVGTFSDGDADGYYTSDSGDGLPLLGTVVLVEE